MELQQRFYNLLFHYTKNENIIASLWKEVHENYSEKHRAYHNLNHLKELFIQFDAYKTELNKPNIVAFSIFYHDIIYKIWNKDNEEKSADFAMTKLSGIINALDIKEIHQQIIATKTHSTTNEDTKWLMDFDLAILGQSEKTYKEYTQLIRKEYKAIPKIIYKSGRKKVLQHFLNKSFIFATKEYRKLHEDKAKENLHFELKSL